MNLLSRLYESKKLREIPRLPCNTANLRSISDHDDYLAGLASTEQHLLDLSCLYCLVWAFLPQKVLEIGTYKGQSALAMAYAMYVNGTWKPSIVTVDIEKVKYLDLIAPSWVEFVVCNSLYYLGHTCKRLTKMFDLVFLDGDHHAVTVYQELVLSMDVLNPGGVIVLHDYYIDSGPFIAVGRLLKENKDLTAVALYPIFHSHMALVLRK